MHITIEGMDGVGKSTAARTVATALGFTLVEKPLHNLLDEDGGMRNYLRIRDWFNTQPNRVLSAWFYGLGNIYTSIKFKGKNIITDRHLLSNYCWSGTAESEAVFDLLVKEIGAPDYTFILYADAEVVRARIRGRDATDTDVEKAVLIPKAYAKMEEFCKRYGMPYMRIDTTALDAEAVSAVIIAKIKELSK
jgi:thymidylate kinase